MWIAIIMFDDYIYNWTNERDAYTWNLLGGEGGISERDLHFVYNKALM